MIRSLSVMSAGVVALAVAGAVQADNDVMRLDGKGDADILETRGFHGGGFHGGGGFGGYRGGFGGYRGGFGYGGYRGIGYGGYRGIGYGGYRGIGYGYGGYGYGGGYYRPYYGFGYGLGLGLGLGYGNGGYYGGYGGYSGGYGGGYYGVGYGGGGGYYGTPYYSSYGLGPCASTTTMVPATTLNLVGPSVPQGTTNGTFPYNGGPQNNYIAPGLYPAGVPNRAGQPRDGYLVSVPAASSGYQFLAFGEQPSMPSQRPAAASDTVRVSYPAYGEPSNSEPTSGFSGGTMVYPTVVR